MDPERRREPLTREQARRRRARQVQRRRLVLVVCLLGLIILIVGLVVGLSGSDEKTTETTGMTGSSGGVSAPELMSATYKAQLSGDQSVPSVTTVAAGTLILDYDADEETLSFVLEITSAITNPSSVTIYEGSPGTAGAAVATLFAGPAKEGRFRGVLAEGFVEVGNLTGSLLGQTIPDLVKLVSTGATYVSVGNTSHPVDAIRGQIQ
jgi:hypothetical protein